MVIGEFSKLVTTPTSSQMSFKVIAAVVATMFAAGTVAAPDMLLTRQTVPCVPCISGVDLSFPVLGSFTIPFPDTCIPLGSTCSNPTTVDAAAITTPLGDLSASATLGVGIFSGFYSTFVSFELTD